MDLEEIRQRTHELTIRANLPEQSATDLAQELFLVLAENPDLPDGAVDSLLFVAACLFRDHANAVEKDILAARDVWQKR